MTVNGVTPLPVAAPIDSTANAVAVVVPAVALAPTISGVRALAEEPETMTMESSPCKRTGIFLPLAPAPVPKPNTRALRYVAFNVAVEGGIAERSLPEGVQSKSTIRPTSEIVRARPVLFTARASRRGYGAFTRLMAFLMNDIGLLL